LVCASMPVERCRLLTVPLLIAEKNAIVQKRTNNAMASSAGVMTPTQPPVPNSWPVRQFPVYSAGRSLLGGYGKHLLPFVLLSGFPFCTLAVDFGDVLRQPTPLQLTPYSPVDVSPFMGISRLGTTHYLTAWPQCVHRTAANVGPPGNTSGREPSPRAHPAYTVRVVL
jgi:hypothetical protein